MLKITTKTTTINGQSVVGDKVIKTFNATLNSDNPNQVMFYANTLDHAAYEEHRAEVRADEDAFEDHAFAVKNEMIAKETEEE